MKLLPLTLFVLLISTLMSSAKDTDKTPYNSPFMNPTSDEALPRVLIIGDSISIAYTTRVRNQLKGKASVHRVPSNCMWSAHGAKNIEKWLLGQQWDVVHFNFGLWDLYGWRQKQKATPESYAKSLDAIVKTIKKTNAKIIFATTTPPCKAPEYQSKVLITEKQNKLFTDAALKVMKNHNVEINDLHALLKKQKVDHHRGEDNVHYTDEGRDLLGQQVADKILDSIAQ